MIFTQILQTMLEQCLTLQIISGTDHYEKERTRKLSGVMKDEFGWKIVKKFIWLKAKTYSYLIDEVVKIKKLKAQKSVL